MPEGDTIARAARRLAPALTGKVLTRAEIRRAVRAPAPGVRVLEVVSVGKHLLIRFDDATTLHTHMQMTGTWQVGRSGERWRRPAHTARVVLATDDGWEAVCFDAPVIQRGPTSREATWIGHLGPDLCRADVDLDLATARFDGLEPSTQLGAALLDQRVAAGIGNVYKSDVCWLHELDPWQPIGGVGVERRHELLATASRLLQANITTNRRVTYRGGLAVYGRAGRPCRRCATTVRVAEQAGRASAQERLTYWCPGCQRVA